MNRLSLCLVALLLAFSACDAEDRNALEEANARLNEEGLFEFADEHLSDDDLAAAVPEGFEFVDVKRNGYDRHHKDWITVGVRMEGPVRFARAIFYVHPDEPHAHEMFEDQSQDPDLRGMGKLARDRHAQPWSEDALEIDNRCSVRADSLFWCHAQNGPVYLVVQSSAGWPTGANVSREERKAAATLLTAFGTYVEEEVPGE